MALNYVRHTLTLIVFFSLAVAGCGDSANRPPPDQVINIGGGGGGTGCSQPFFPTEEPDMSPLAPPEFVTEEGQEQRLVRPGQELLAEITVNGATRQIFVELSDAWSPLVILTQELETPGSQTIPLTFLTDRDTRGRFYMRIALCGEDCNEREVIFDIIEPDLDDQANTGINADYERTLIENGEVVRVDQTCVRPNTVLIQ
ncbi:MAG: hypothetical protein JRJ80_09265 [Deltaproteobacteria bacterium]|nr:hypothetical protein [Deltaproteobacteria bacterium]MBW2379598.1 hypothetical protein [Deltaproteobacteria bacterium]MBW2687494.1 hypothetical protein [Deltaproteobacteria bacterium]